jgi:hypothetical protein
MFFFPFEHKTEIETPALSLTGIERRVSKTSNEMMARRTVLVETSWLILVTKGTNRNDHTHQASQKP